MKAEIGGGTSFLSDSTFQWQVKDKGNRIEAIYLKTTITTVSTKAVICMVNFRKKERRKLLELENIDFTTHR